MDFKDLVGFLDIICIKYELFAQKFRNTSLKTWYI